MLIGHRSILPEKGLLPVFLVLLHALLAGDLLAQTNGVVRELYTGIAGGSVPELTNAPSFPSNPTDVFIEADFEAPYNFTDQYGQRMRALLCQPVTGSYTFWIASDDNSVLYLSTDESPARKALIAYETSWTSWRAWNTHPSQKSVAITLNAGSRYYIEALQKEGGGGDNLSVTWQKPGDATPADGSAPIPGQYLVPYGLGPPVITAHPSNVTVMEGGTATFSVALAMRLGVVYQWRRGGVILTGATNSSYSIASAALVDSGSQFSCAITNAYGGTNSNVATLSVNPDVTRPAIISAGNLGNAQLVTVIFSEPVEPSSATLASNYSISGGVTVLSAAFGLDSRMILLTTTPMVTQTNYVLTVNNVRDRATTPNAISPDSQVMFRLDAVPLDVSFIRPSADVPGASSRHGPVVISELMYHPPARADGKNIEFIELYNSNPYFEDLSEYKLSGDVEFTFPTNTLLAGRSFLVVAASPADLQSVYSAITVLGPYTKALPNRSGAVRLKNRQGGILFEVSYSSDSLWPAAADGAGHSLVLAWPSLGERNPAAWSASSFVGGNPGRLDGASYSPYRTVMLNEILAHTDPPEVDYVELYNYCSTPVDLSGCVLTDDPDTNKFLIPAGTSIPPLGFVCFTQEQLGFALSAAGETIYFKDPVNTRILDVLRFGAQENSVALGRFPDGGKEFSRLQEKTPGAPNAPRQKPEIVINEIMYAPITGDEDDQYVEVHNRTANSMDLSRWSFEDGINYTFPPGTTIPAGGYLVVARNAVRLMSDYPNLNGINTLGNFSGTLARSGERLILARPDEILSTNLGGVVLTNRTHIPVDEVRYDVGGRWGAWSHGGGSSLELIDPEADHRLAPNWADSDGSTRSGWTNLEYTGVLDNGNVSADSLQIITLGAGEYLIDDIEVILPGGPNLVRNPSFESGLDGWVPQGNHEDSSLETREGYQSAQSLHVRATGRGDTGANRIRTALSSALSAGQTATIRAKVRWLAGWPEILLRLRGNWLEASGQVLSTPALGTPGMVNSRSLLNAGPAITDVRHWPVLPVAGQAVTVSARVDDPDGIAALVLKYRTDPSTNVALAHMVNNGAGLFSASIPGQPAGTIVAFSIEAMDNTLPRRVTRFPNNAPTRECVVRFGDPAQNASFATYRLWMTKATFDRWSRRERLSNKPLDCTFVYGNSRVIYNVGAQYSGSPWHAPGFDSPTGNVCDYVFTFPEDDPLLGETEATLQWPGNGGGDNTYQREQTAYWIAEQLGLPYCYRRSINLLVNGVRRAEMFEDVQQPNGDMMDEFYPDGKGGDLHKIQLWFEFDDAAATFTANGASLQNVTTTGGRKKLSYYRWTFAKRAPHGSASDYTNLFALVDAANYSGLGANYRRQLEAKVDVDNWLKTYAVEHIVGNGDSFAYGGGQNMYTYKPPGDTWKMLIWDIDFAFWGQDPSSDVFQGIGRSNGIDLSEPTYKRRYWQILQDLAKGPLVSTRVNPMLDAKYSAFIANGRSVENPATIKTYITQRRVNLLSLIATNVVASFAITSNGGVGFSTGQNLVNLAGTAPLDVRLITVNGVAYSVTWNSVSNWTALVALSPGTNTLLVQGWDASSNALPGATASIPIHYTGSVQSPQGNLMISEIMYNPAVPDASFIEIYNAASNSFDLCGWKLNGADYTFPGGTVITPRSYVVVSGHRLAFASAYGATIPVAGEFQGRLDNDGETLQLIQPGAVSGGDIVVDEVRYESCLPWPAAANGTGPSLQLIDVAQDNNRVANWGVVPTSLAPPGPRWRYVTATGSATSSSLYLYLQNPGEAYVDDIQLVAGTVPESGPNLVVNGDFESAYPGAWGVSANLSGSSLSGVIKHSGGNSLHMVASSAGSSRSSAIYQDISPALTLNAPYTLSFWVLENTNGGTLTVRLSGSGIIANVSLLPDAGPATLALATPGSANSVRAVLPGLPTLWLNEVVANNTTGLVDRFGHRHPWIELYNNGPTNLSLAGVFMANNYTNLLQWPFPAGTSIGSGQFLLVWADGNTAESAPNELHTSFAIPATHGAVALVSTNGGSTNILDYLNYGLLQPDRSYGAFPDGSPGRRQYFRYVTPAETNNPAIPPLNVSINEWMADNQTTIADPADHNFEDWFELHNPGSTPADLSGFYLGQSLSNRTKFLIPAGYTVPGNGYLLVWADEDTEQNSSNRLDLHVNFKLSKNGDGIGLFAPDAQGTIVDFVSFQAQATDLSQGRFPDGWPSISTFTAPTPGSTNFLDLPNTNPEIEEIASRTIFEGQLLSLQIVAADRDLPAQQLTFSFAPGAPENAALNPETGLLSWRPEPGQSPATNTMTVLVTDNGVPPLTASCTFAVRVVARPQITSVRPNGFGGFRIDVVAVPGKTYRLEYKDDLRDVEWRALTPGVSAEGDTLPFEDEVVTASKRFYRVVVSD